MMLKFNGVEINPNFVSEISPFWIPGVKYSEPDSVAIIMNNGNKYHIYNRSLEDVTHIIEGGQS